MAAGVRSRRAIIRRFPTGDSALSVSQRTDLRATAGLTLAALGVVYGDIGTSPLYAFKEAFGGPHAMPLSQDNVYAVLSLMFWAVTLIVSLKYVTFMLRFDHRGEGGVLALLTHAMHLTREAPGRAGRA